MSGMGDSDPRETSPRTIVDGLAIDPLSGDLLADGSAVGDVHLDGSTQPATIAGPAAMPRGVTFVAHRVVVSGADSAVGRAAAEFFADRGADLGLLYTQSRERALDTAQSVAARGRRAVMSRLDPTEVESVRDQVEDVVDELGGVDVLVVDGRIDNGGSMLEVEPQQWRTVLSAQLDSSFFAIQLAARRMVRDGRGGRIIAVTWLPDHYNLTGSAALEAAEDGLSGIVRRTALELGQHGITVNAVSPGAIAPIGSNGDVVREDIPLGRVGHPRDVAHVIGFLASSDADYITGASIPVDGGMQLTGPAPARIGSTRP